jgi:hypothetical protein
MADEEMDLLTDVEKQLRDKFEKEGTFMRMPSTASESLRDERVVQLALPDEKRGRMPFTRDKYVVRENPFLVEWEREVRKFCHKLNHDYGHRISATMIYEWVTGISVRELMESGGNPSPDLRKINQILRHYFGKAYSTWIMGRKVPNCYRVPSSWYMTRHRPMTMTLTGEWYEGVLRP